MKFLILTFILLSINLVLAIAQPIIEIEDGDTYNWGKVSSKDGPLKATFIIKNVGNEKLIIKEVKPSCGCTITNLEKNELEPGEKTNLPVIFNIAGAHNKISKTIRITSNDRINGDKIIKLEADIYNLIDLIPGNSLIFGEMKTGKEDSTSVIIINNSKEPVVISSFEEQQSDTVKLNITGDQTIQPGKEFELMITAKANYSGLFNCDVRIKTSHPDYPEIKISCFGKVID